MVNTQDAGGTALDRPSRFAFSLLPPVLAVPVYALLPFRAHGEHQRVGERIRANMVSLKKM